MRLLLYALLALVLLVLVFPVLFMLLTSFKTSSEFLRLPPTLFPRAATLANYPYLFRQMRYFMALRNTVLVAGLSALGATLLGGMAASAPTSPRCRVAPAWKSRSITTTSHSNSGSDRGVGQPHWQEIGP